MKDLRFSVSPFLVLYAAYFVFSKRISEGAAYFVALVLHEFAHAYVAEKRGYKLERLKLGVFGASLSGKFETLEKNDEIAIAAAGPAFNLFSAAFFTALFWVFPAFYVFFIDFVYASLALFAFNLLPVYPLDGGRVLNALLTARFTRTTAYKTVRVIGFAISALLTALAVISAFYGFNPSLVTGAVFAFASAAFPDDKSKYAGLFRLSYRSERLKKGLKVREIAVKRDFPIKSALSLLDPDRYTAFVILGDSLTPVAVLPETAFELPARAKLTSVSELYDAYAEAERAEKVKN